MHLPYPPRKSSNPAPFIARGSRTPNFSGRLALPRRYRGRAAAIAVIFIVAVVWLLTRGGSLSHAHKGGRPGMANHVPSGKPPVVIVTALDEETFGTKYADLLKENRKLYAERHGRFSLALATEEGVR